MPDASTAAATGPGVLVPRRLEYLPVALFGSVMGLSGLSVAWRLSAAHYGAPDWIALGIAGAAVLAFVVMAIAYAIKTVAPPDAVGPSSTTPSPATCSARC